MWTLNSFMCSLAVARPRDNEAFRIRYCIRIFSAVPRASADATRHPLRALKFWPVHPRNRHRDGYDFVGFAERAPELAPFVKPHPIQGLTIDFSDPLAVMTLNRALLRDYGVKHWQIPAGYLCPGVPGRADYIHTVADLLASDRGGEAPIGKGARVLDVGTGANCVYPLIGHGEYGWTFVATDIDLTALESARRILAGNPTFAAQIEIRAQAYAPAILSGVINKNERFAASMCNPPFHASAEAAIAGTQRKIRNLGNDERERFVLNFGGQSHELWCRGGEPSFIKRLIDESAQFPETCAWYTTLVSKSSTLPAIEKALKTVPVREVRQFDLTQGQKKSRIVAWTFLGREERVRSSA
jgi:23S rRNA (adenine1618-N6)-methyltransferase